MATAHWLGVLAQIPRVLTFTAGLALLGSGCTGVIGGGESSNGDGTSAPPSAGGRSGGGSTDPAPPGTCAADAPVLEARLLSPRQYDYTVTDLFGFESGAIATLSEGGGVTFGLVKLDEVGVERFELVADGVAEGALQNLAQIFPCATTVVPEDPCVQTWIGDLAKRAYRRPVTSTELAELAALFGAGVSEGGVPTGVQWLVSGVLQSPDFLYRMVLNPAGSTAAVRALSGHELANRLSYFLWDSMPDQSLFSAADAGTLSTPAGLESEALRMLTDGRFHRALETFYEHWLNLGVFAEVARDAPDFTQPVIDSLRRSVQVGLQALYAQPEPNAAELFLGTTYYMDGVLAGFYGVTSPDPTSFVPIELGQEGRRGILTHPALMTALARPDQAFPIGRGLFVLESLLCLELTPPQIDVPPLPAIPEGGTERDQLELHSKDPACASCHSMIDPFGFAFQDFDEVGRYRAGMNSSGALVGLGEGIDGPFASGTELIERLGQSENVRQCLATHFFEYGMSRHALPGDDCSLAPIRSSFAETGDLKNLILKVVQSHAFQNRLAEVPQP